MLKRIAGLPPALIALLIQGAAYIVSLLGVHFLGVRLTFIELSFICGTLAAAAGYFAGLAIWWLPIQFLFIPALTLAMSFHLSSSVYLVAFLALLVIYWSTFRTQVPLYLSSKKVWRALENLLPDVSSKKRFDFIDLGCGMGGVLTYLGKARGDGNFHGVESAPLPFIVSWLRIRLSRQSNCRVHWGNMWAVHLGQYDVVYAYLSPVPMEDLWAKARREMRPGALLISNTFDVPGCSPEHVVQVNDLHGSVLFIWKL